MRLSNRVHDGRLVPLMAETFRPVKWRHSQTTWADGELLHDTYGWEPGDDKLYEMDTLEWPPGHIGIRISGKAAILDHNRLLTWDALGHHFRDVEGSAEEIFRYQYLRAINCVEPQIQLDPKDLKITVDVLKGMKYKGLWPQDQ